MSEARRELMFGMVPFIGSLIELAPDYRHFKVTVVEPAIEHGYEIRWNFSISEASPRAWWVTLEPASLREVEEIRDQVEKGWQQRNEEANRSLWDKVLRR